MSLNLSVNFSLSFSLSFSETDKFKLTLTPKETERKTLSLGKSRHWPQLSALRQFVALSSPIQKVFCVRCFNYLLAGEGNESLSSSGGDGNNSLFFRLR